MGGGNGQKSRMAREKHMEKQKAAGKGSQLESNKKAMTIQDRTWMSLDNLLQELFRNMNYSMLGAWELRIVLMADDHTRLCHPVQGVHADVHMYDNRSEMQGARGGQAPQD